MYGRRAGGAVPGAAVKRSIRHGLKPPDKMWIAEVGVRAINWPCRSRAPRIAVPNGTATRASQSGSHISVSFPPPSLSIPNPGSVRIQRRWQPAAPTRAGTSTIRWPRARILESESHSRTPNATPPRSLAAALAPAFGQCRRRAPTSDTAPNACPAAASAAALRPWRQPAPTPGTAQNNRPAATCAAFLRQ